MLGFLGITLGPVRSAIDPPLVRAEGEAGEALRLMLRSHTTWKTCRGEITTQWFNPDGNNQTYSSILEIENPNRAHLEIIDQNGSRQLQWYGDGREIYEINPRDNTYVAIPQPDPTRILGRLPQSLGDVIKGTIYRHPLAMVIPSPAIDYVFPVGLAQRPGEYQLGGEANVSGRKAWIIEYQNQNDSGVITMMARYWVDQQTGVILRANVFSTNPEGFGRLIEVSTFTGVEFDQSIDAARFTPSLAGLKVDIQLPSIP